MMQLPNNTPSTSSSLSSITTSTISMSSSLVINTWSTYTSLLQQATFAIDSSLSNILFSTTLTLSGIQSSSSRISISKSISLETDYSSVNLYSYSSIGLSSSYIQLSFNTMTDTSSITSHGPSSNLPIMSTSWAVTSTATISGLGSHTPQTGSSGPFQFIQSTSLYQGTNASVTSPSISTNSVQFGLQSTTSLIWASSSPEVVASGGPALSTSSSIASFHLSSQLASPSAPFLSSTLTTAIASGQSITGTSNSPVMSSSQLVLSILVTSQPSIASIMTTRSTSLAASPSGSTAAAQYSSTMIPSLTTVTTSSTVLMTSLFGTPTCPVRNQTIYTNSGSNSTWMIECYWDRAGGSSVTQVGNFSACIAACDRTSTCLGAAFSNGTGALRNCYLKASQGPVAQAPTIFNARKLFSVSITSVC